MKMKTVYDDMRSPIESLLQFLLRLKTTWCCLQCNDYDENNDEDICDGDDRYDDSDEVTRLMF